MDRICSKCNLPKPPERYRKRNICLDCQAAYKRLLRKGIRSPIPKPEVRVCRDCNQPEGPDRLFRKKANWCRECYLKFLKTYRDTHVDEVKEKVRKWKADNRERVRETTRALYETEAGKARHIRRVTKTPRTWLSRCVSSAKKESINPSAHSPKDALRREFDIDLDYVMDIFNKQEGKCAITGLVMTHRYNDLFAASVDRIDSSRGHIKGNIQIVCQAVNKAKGRFPNHQAVDFFRAISVGRTPELDFSKLDLQTLEADDYIPFYARHHYLGETRHFGRTLGAYLYGTLIAAATISSVTRHETATKQGLQPSQVRELVRFCIHRDYHAKNLGSWFMAKVVKMVKNEMPDVKLLISFADSTVGHDGTLYLASNWKLDGKTSGSYHYVDQSGKKWHKKTIYGRALALGVTEGMFARNEQLSKVRHLAKYRFLLRIE